MTRRGRVRPDTSSAAPTGRPDRKITRLNSSHVEISYAVFCLKKKKKVSHLAAVSLFPLQASRALRAPLSFPTRRSSDLLGRQLAAIHRWLGVPEHALPEREDVRRVVGLGP